MEPDVSVGARKGRRVIWESLRFKLTAGIVAVLLIVSLLLANLAVNRLEEEYTTLIVTNQSSNVTVLTRMVQNDLKERLAALDALAKGMPMDDWSKPALVQPYLNSKPVAATLFRRDLYVISVQGIRIAEFPRRGSIGTDYRESPYIKQVMARRQAVVMPLLGRFSKRPNLIFAVPVLGERGEVLAVVCGSEELAVGSPFYLSDFARNGREGGYHVVALNERVVVASSDASRVLQPVPAEGVNSLFDRRVNENYLGPGRTVDSRGLSILSVAERIPGVDWLVLSYVSEKEAYAPMAGLARMIWMGALFAGGLIGLLAWWWARGQLRPLEEAATLIERVDASTLEIPVLPEEGSGEVRLLLGHFNRLHEIIHTQYLALQGEKERLETAVGHRTRALMESERFLRIVTDGLPGGVAYWDAELRLRFANQVALEWFARTLPEMSGVHIEDLLGREQVRNDERHIAAALQGKAQNFERRMVGTDGQPVDLLVHYIPNVSDGEVLGFFSYATDISEVKRSQQLIEDQAVALDDLYNHAPCGYHTLAADGTILQINDTELGWLGYAREELLGGKRFQELLTEKSRQAFSTHFATPLAQGHFNEMELELVCADGRIVPVLASASLERNADDNSLTARFALVDYTRLREQQGLLRGVLRSAPVAVRIAALADNRLLFMNDAFCRLVHLSESEALHMDISRSYTEPAEFLEIRERVEAGEVVLNRLVELHVPEQPEIPHAWVIASYMPIEYEGQRAVLAWVFNVTELHQARAAAEAAAAAKSEFLANMSHEIRTPMNAILGLAYVLERESLSPDARAVVRRIRSAGRTLQGIINDILDFSRIEAGRLAIENAAFRMTDILDNVAAIMASTAGEKSIELVIDPPPTDCDLLMGDALRIEQVLINLANNAIKFTERGFVKVGLSKVAEQERLVTLRFAVKDTGIGMSEDTQRRIFSPFTQADTSTTRRFGGTGLGLSISHRLVSLMGGEMGVSSTPGEGSDFWFTLTLERCRGGSVAPHDLSTLHVLVADDNPIALDVLGETVKSLGWSVCAVNSGEGVLSIIRGREPAQQHDNEVILLDWDMPGLDGLATAREIAHFAGPDREPIVIMVTAHNRDELLALPDVQHVDAVLSKPVTGSALYNAVAKAIQVRQGNTPPAEVEPRSEHRLRGLRLLVVDDSDINLDVAERIFGLEGAQVITCADGQEAVDWLQAHADTVDVVLMDLQMPEMDGITATRLIRERLATHTLPIVALSAGVMQEQQDAALAAGMNAFIAKPIDVENAVATLCRLTGTHPTQAPPVAGDAPALPAPAGPDAASDLPGLSVSRGIRVFGVGDAYRRYLRRFLNEYADVATQLAAAPADSRVRLAHKLKGVAANLGIDQVAAAAGAVEAQARTGTMDDALLPPLAARLDEARQSILSYLEAPADTTAPVAGNAEADPARLRELLSRLVQALAEDRPDSAEPLLNDLAEQMSEPLLQPVRDRLENFDFRGAELAVRELGRRVGITWEGEL